jgi:hypothetical protein
VKRELKYWPDRGYCDVLELEDDRPVRFSSLMDIPTPAQAAELAARIEALTGYAVRFGEWEEVLGDPRDGRSTVELFVVDRRPAG